MSALRTPLDTPDFGARLRAWREGNRFDLDAAACLLGVSGNFLYMINFFPRDRAFSPVKRFR